MTTPLATAPPVRRPGFQELAGTLRARRGRILAAVFGVALVAVPLLLLQKNHYTASVAVVPEVRSGETGGQLSALAAVAGLSGLTASSSRSPAFYKALLEERSLRYAVLRRRYPAAGLGSRFARRDSATLLEILRPRGDDEAQRMWNAADRLGGMVAIGLDPKTSIIRVNVTHTSPPLAAGVASAHVEELQRFNLEQRQSQARQRRRFVESRVREVSAQLAEAEDAVRQFLQRNRQFEGSPALVFELGRLQRSVTVEQELFLDLQRQLDAARIAEVDDRPTVTVVEPAIVPQRKAFPRRSRQLIKIVLVAGLIACAWVLLRAHHAQIAPGVQSALEAVSPRTARWLLGRGVAA